MMVIENLLQAYKVFSSNVSLMSWFWKSWIYLMIIINGIFPIFFLPRFTSFLVLISAILGIFSGLVLTHATGYSKLLGLMHLPWVPMVCFQIHYFYQHKFKIESAHDYWLLVSLIISVLSLILDFNDILIAISNKK